MLKQTASKIRSLLRSAGCGVPVQLRWIASYLKIDIAEVSAALDIIETRTFRVMRFRGAGASVAMA